MTTDKQTTSPSPFPTSVPDDDTVLLLGVPPQIVQAAVDLLDSQVTGEKGKQARAICNALESCVQLRVAKDQLPKPPGDG